MRSQKIKSFINHEGSRVYLLGRKKHREDGPAITDLYGNRFWYIKNKLHRDNGPALEYCNGHEEWFKHGKVHREDGPATICPPIFKAWSIDNELHRIDGPAVEYSGGYKEWWIKDQFFETKEEWFAALTKEQQMNYLWNAK